MKEYFRLLLEGKIHENKWERLENMLKNVISFAKPYGKQLVHGKTGKIVTTGPTDSQHYDIVLSNLSQFGFHSLEHMADTVNAHNAHNPEYKPLTSESVFSEMEGFTPVIDYLQDHGWAHVTHMTNPKNPTTYISTADHKSAQSAIGVIKDQLLPAVSIDVRSHTSELKSRQEIEEYRTSADPSTLWYTSRNTIETRQPTEAERISIDNKIRKAFPEHDRPFESFTFSKLRTQLNEGVDDIHKYIKHGEGALRLHSENTIRSVKESWQEYDAKVGEINTSLFEPDNTKFNMKKFLKKLRKKNGLVVNLPGEN